MLKVKSFQTAQDLADYLNQEGLSIDDLRAATYMNASNWWTAFIADEEPLDVIDTAAGTAGMSVAVAALTNATEATVSLSTHRRTETEVTTTANSDLEVSQALTFTTTAPASVYVVPGSVEITSGEAPTVVDNGYGKLIEEDSGIRLGTITYTNTPTVAFTYRNRGGYLPSTTTDEVAINYQSTAYPDGHTFPAGTVRINRIVLVDISSASVSSVDYELYGDSDASDASFVASGTIAVSSDRGAALLDPSPLSASMELTAADRDLRWMKVTSNATGTLGIFVWWEKVG